MTNCNTNCSTTAKYWKNMAFFQKHFSPIHLLETNSLLNHWSMDIYTVYFTSTTHLTMVMIYPIELISRVYSSHQFKLQKEHKSRMDTRLSSLSHQFEQPQCTLDYYKNSFFTLGHLCLRKSPIRDCSIYSAMFIYVIPVKSYIWVTFMLLFCSML